MRADNIRFYASIGTRDSGECDASREYVMDRALGPSPRDYVITESDLK